MLLAGGWIGHSGGRDRRLSTKLPWVARPVLGREGRPGSTAVGWVGWLRWSDPCHGVHVCLLGSWLLLSLGIELGWSSARVLMSVVVGVHIVFAGEWAAAVALGTGIELASGGVGCGRWYYWQVPETQKIILTLLTHLSCKHPDNHCCVKTGEFDP